MIIVNIIMSIRNKKLTALQTLNHSLEHSLQKAKVKRTHGSQQKRQNPLLAKIGQTSAVRKFQVRRVTQPQQQLSETKARFRSLRMHTEKVPQAFSQLVTSPHSLKYKSPYQRSHTIDIKETQKQEKYPFITHFEREEISRYEVFYVGPRRIHNIKDFTNSSCEARIATGDSIGYRYEVVSGLGHGSFGQVFKVFDHKKKEMLALKIIRNQPKFNRQAKVEIRILEAVIMHDPKFRSNVVQLKHGFFFRGHACLVFELLHINLYEFLKMYKFSGLNLDLIRRITIQILQSLTFFKKHKIIHCDLKPENILLKQEGKTGIKVIDTGSGCFEGEQIYTYIQSRYYRAPEVIMGVQYTNSIDIWSLGCILCQLLLGYPVFPGENEPEQMLMFMEVLGIPPASLIEKGSRSHKFFEGLTPKLKLNSKGKIRKPNTKSLSTVLKVSEDFDFIRFVQKFFKWNPQQRITAQQALLDPWIIKGLPEDIKKQHLASLRRQKEF